MLTQLAALVAPPLCWSCAAAAPRGSPLCRACARGLRRLPPELVDLAGVPCFSAVAYEGAARDARARAQVPRRAGRRGLDGGGDRGHRAGRPVRAGAALVPVPLAPARARRRGFNQALVLARALERRTGCTVVECLERRAGPGAPRSAATAPSGHAR